MCVVGLLYLVAAVVVVKSKKSKAVPLHAMEALGGEEV
jgi:predicted transporter